MTEPRVVLLDPIASLEVKEPPVQGYRRWRSRHEDKDRLAGRPAIYMTQDAYLEVNEHAEGSLHREIGGMLVGQAFRSPQGGLFLMINAHLSARHVDHGATHMTFTSNSLTDLLLRLEEEYPDQRFVGWYHTHPALSVFLSSMDIWLHTNFFKDPWHIALVIDPVSREGGFFSYSRGDGRLIHSTWYAGFNELIPPGGDSIVSWANLEPVDLVAISSEQNG